MAVKPFELRKFGGIANKSPPERLLKRDGQFQYTPGLQAAENVDITDDFTIRVREGTAPVLLGNFTSGFSISDGRRAFLASSTSLYEVMREGSEFSVEERLAGLSGGEWFVTEMNDIAYLTNGVDALVITGDEVRLWGIPLPTAPEISAISGALPEGQYQVTVTYVVDGRESGAPPATRMDLDGSQGLAVRVPLRAGAKTRVYLAAQNDDVLRRVVELPQATADGFQTITWGSNVLAAGPVLDTQFLRPPPAGTRVAAVAGRVFIGRSFPEVNLSVVYPSLPLAYELFDVFGEAILIPGELRLLGASNGGLVIGTDQEIGLWADGEYSTLAHYGAVDGDTGVVLDDGRLMFWTERGACQAMPFKNLTEAKVSVPSGKSGRALHMKRRGYEKYIVSVVNGGQSHNPFE